MPTDRFTFTVRVSCEKYFVRFFNCFYQITNDFFLFFYNLVFGCEIVFDIYTDGLCRQVAIQMDENGAGNVARVPLDLLAHVHEHNRAVGKARANRVLWNLQEACGLGDRERHKRSPQGPSTAARVRRDSGSHWR